MPGSVAIDRAAAARPRVLIVQRRLTHYRLPLFERMRAQLAEQGIALDLAVGQATQSELEKRDEGQLPWTQPLATRYLLDDRICWLDYGRLARGAELVIVPQENQLVYNLLALTVQRPRRIAFWGHGRNMQSRAPRGLRERFKRATLTAVDWWFAYTAMTLPVLQQARMDASRITVLDNAVDTRALAADWQAVVSQRDALRAELGLGAGPVGVFVGSLYADKRIPFLLEAAQAIRQQVPDFRLLVVGDGPSRPEVVAFADRQPWVQWLGMRSGAAKARVLAASDVLLNPGLVGLGILDSFACEIPMFTTDCGIHSPEICYLENGVNGVITPNTLADYVAAVVEACTLPDVAMRLKAGLRVAGQRYTIENMADNFCRGIQACLQRPAARS